MIPAAAPCCFGMSVMRGTSYFSAFSALFRPLAQLSQQGQGFGIIPLGRALQPEGGLRGVDGNAVAPQQA